jgi:3-deoxy-D-manno-octulosonic-acid transferase
VKHNQTSSLRENKSTISQEQWEGILSTILLGTAPDEGQAAAEAIEAVARADESAITILIQRHVEGITV